MITVICGKPRGGKSYYAVMQLCYELRNSRRYIVTNLPLDLVELAAWAAKWGISAVEVRERVRILSDQEVFRFWLHDPEGTIEGRINIGLLELKGGVRQHEVSAPDFSRRQAVDYPGVVYFIDEGHVFFDARNTLKVAEDLSYFLSQHGHLRCDVWFISQHPKKLDMRIRLDAQEYTVCSNLGNEKGFMGVSIKGVFRRATFLDLPGGMEKPVETGTYRLNAKEYGKLYATSAGVGLSGRVDTQEQKHGRHWGRWFLPVVAFCLLGCVLPMVVLKGVGMGISGALRSYLGAASGMSSNVTSRATGSFLGSTNRPVVVRSDAGSSVVVGPTERALVPEAGNGLHVTGYSPMCVCLDDGRVLWANEWELLKVRGGVEVRGLGFIPWAEPLRSGVSAPGAGAGAVRALPRRLVRGSGGPAGAVGPFGERGSLSPAPL